MHYTESITPPLPLLLLPPDIRATADEPTPVNLFNHPYLNLAGMAADDSSILGHVLTVNATHYMATDESGAATGDFLPVDGTPLDFTVPHTIGERINGGWSPVCACSWAESAAEGWGELSRSRRAAGIRSAWLASRAGQRSAAVHLQLC